MFSKSDIVYRIVRDKILSGALQPGQALRERSICAELPAGRTPVREALLRLQHEGLLENGARNGKIVRVWSRDDILARFDLRCAVEGTAMRWAARRMTREIHERLIATCEKGESLVRENRLTEAEEEDVRFHNILVRASGNKEVIRAAKLFHITATILPVPTDDRGDAMMSGFSEHRKIADAVRDGDVPRAKEVFQKHIKRGIERVTAWFDRMNIETEEEWREKLATQAVSAALKESSGTVAAETYAG